MSSASSSGSLLNGADWVWDVRMRRVWWSDAVAALLGPSGGITTAALLALVYPEDRERLGREARRARRTQTPFAVACRFLRPDGALVWYTLHGQWHSPSGAPARLFGLIIELAASGVQATLPLDLAQISVALRASQAREQARAAELQTVLDAVPAIVWVAHDPDCRVITGNRAAQAFLRMAPGSNLSKSAPDEERPAHFRVLKDGVELAIEELPVQMAARGIAVVDFEEQVIFDDGTVRILLGNATPLWDAEGRPRGAVAAFLDITERQESERERLRLLAEARTAQSAVEVALRMRDELIAVISHDLNNPLTVIMGQTQLLQRRLSRPVPDLARATGAVEAIEQAARQLFGQIGELLDVAQLQSGKPLELRREPTDMAALVRRVAVSFQHTTERHHIVVTAADNLSLIAIDPVRFERALSNLLANALKYSPGGGAVTVNLYITSGPGDSPEVMVLAIEDHGVGIPAADLPHVFERYRRARNALDFPGTGLGLASTRQIIEQHQGTITIASVEGAGTVVTVTLPLDPPDGQEQVSLYRCDQEGR